MNTKKLENEIFFLDEKNYLRALSEMKSFCNACNKIVEILQENDLKITHENAMELVFTPFDTLNRVIVENWRKGAENVPAGVEIQMKTPEINKIPMLQNSLTYSGAYNTGYIPRDYLKFENGLFFTDEEKLREYFTIYKTPVIIEISEAVERFLTVYEQLKEISKKHSLGNLVDFYGILQFDMYKGEFSFNKSSDILFQLKRNSVNNKK